ncbi:MAG: DUF1127 domain-containing protein [Sneathiella sp.]|uniref:DUF1127 domain-containing protein n=1 Tax=Sneathiella sp. TaxID=1964365 RepID=UPI003001F45B
MSDTLQNTCCVISNPPGKREDAKNTSFLALFGTVAHRFRLWRRARATQILLWQASDRTLKDIGVNRRDIMRSLPRADDEILEIERRRFLK